jgi:hypothetical protein
MKKLTTALMVLAVTAAFTQTARAGDREWATAGKVLTGVIAGAAIVHALQPQPTCVYTAPPVVYAPTPAPVVYAPPPPQVVVYAAPVYLRPPPIVSVHFGMGYRHHHFRGHGCR